MPRGPAGDCICDSIEAADLWTDESNRVHAALQRSHLSCQTKYTAGRIAEDSVELA